MSLSAIKYAYNKANLSKFKRFYYEENGKKVGLDIGGYESQEINMSNTITDNPVEFGANKSDSIYRNPVKIKVAIIVSDSSGAIANIISNVKSLYSEASIQSSVEEFGGRFLDSSASSSLKSSKVYNKIIFLMQNFTPCEIITRDRIYKNLQIENISRAISFENYGGAVIMVDLKELITFGDGSENNLLGESPKENGFMSKKELGLEE